MVTFAFLALGAFGWLIAFFGFLATFFGLAAFSPIRKDPVAPMPFTCFKPPMSTKRLIADLTFAFILRFHFQRIKIKEVLTLNKMNEWN